MSLRIHNDPSAGVASTEVSRTSQPASGASGSGKSRSAFGVDSGDHVQVSSIAEGISAGISAQNVSRAARVSQLSALYASGQYKVDSSAVSQAVVGNAVKSSVAGKA
jgi:anti-sigma28 factor (negative regulator of flagellin synthesis)